MCSVILISAQVKKAENRDSNTTVVEDIKNYSEEDNFFSRIVKSVLVPDDELGRKRTPPDPDKKIIKQFSGKRIRNIIIEIVDVFGGSVEHPDDTLRSWVQSSGNKLHINSREWIIRNMLIFSEGEKLIPFHIEESERILRQTPSVYDARIIPRRITNSRDSIDIMVYIQDVWSINGSVGYSPENKTGKASITDINFLGLGNALRGGFKSDREFSRGWDWDGSYSIYNIEKTFASANMYYLSEVNSQRYGMAIGRDFFSPIISWAGGIGQHWQNTVYPAMLNAKGISETVRYNQQDYWGGYAFNIGYFDLPETEQNRFNISGRITRTVYSERPALDTMNQFQDNTFYLGRIGFAYREYYQDSYIFGLGKTEDVPLIQMISFLFGYEKGARSSRPYYGMKTGYSVYDEQLGYFYGGFQSGAFLSNKKWLDRVAFVEVLYFSHLNAIGKWNWRQYLGSRYSYRYDPLDQIGVLTVNNEGGIRGFSDGPQQGTKRLVVNYEVDIFVPLKLVGFKLAIITFADFGILSSNNNSIFNSVLYQGYGFGFRVRNEHLIFPTFQFMFGLYPNTPLADGVHFNMFRQSAIYYRFNQFQFSTPSIVTID